MGKIRHASAASRFYGIECEEEMQGLLALRADKVSRIAATAKLPTVYVDYISTAPWNYEQFLGLINDKGRFRGCGRIFMAAAVTLSLERGYNGRVSLHSLIDAENFYRNVCGMTDMGIDLKYEGLLYFEMTSSQAKEFMGRTRI